MRNAKIKMKNTLMTLSVIHRYFPKPIRLAL